MKVYALITALAVMFGVAVCHADVPAAAPAAPAAISATAGPVTPTPKWFNGNWLPYKERSIDESKSIAAQMLAYKDAKTKGDLEATVANAVWPSVQAWAFNRAVRDQIAKAEGQHEPDKSGFLKEGLTYADSGLKVLDTKTEAIVPAGLSTDEVKAFTNEHAERVKARVALQGNRLFIRCTLGLDPWPKEGK